ncbi:hypothetical protein MN116_008071 [Schistosoma mekongi]|uniref:Uncharacterized protein n=1 Tax=Schistosoma mekongi TaxID=38744 RepID=A0AAE1Z652_SCHME|nr:hypothetical protein MN116_008071 [Schistosoma mekongi]
MNSASIHNVNVNTTNSPVYVIFSTDCGISKQQLRCDYLSWGLNVTLHVRYAQFRYTQANMRVNRFNELSSYTTITSFSSRLSSCIPHFLNHPVALAYSPLCYRIFYDEKYCHKIIKKN